ncbi:MAG TPA: hypothetical protein VNW53_15020 [Phenylobacterium sp.]|uniref:hypothetical protein n=1 Tax=Phenylobacterium sp. TaxID=1871053 RepID=UPI002C17A8EF|nr:hypothetical protein [Phenylobacterium sp.]HXA40307.1 hypothetical protein [Phenylobacterium sp.]
MSGDDEWARCAPWLEAALDHAGRTHALADVKAAVDRGEARLWPGAASALVAAVEQDPGERRLLIWLAGGERQELEGDVLPQVEAWGRAQRCRRVLVIGRAGWERTLKPHGYAPLARIIAKDL